MEKMTQAEHFTKALDEFTKAYNEMKACGIDQELIIAFIFYKTRLSKKIILQVLNHQEQFYDKIISKDIVNALKEKK